MFDFLFKQKKIRPIGLDIGHSQIRMIQLSCQDGDVRVEAAQEEILDRQLEYDSQSWRQHVVETIQKMTRQGGFVGQQVISCLPDNIVKVKSLRLDTNDPEQIESVMKKEVAPRFGMDADVDEIRYIVAGNVYQGEEIKNEVIFFGIQKDQLASHLDLLEQANLTPVSIDTTCCALFRSFQATLRRREDRQQVSVFVNLGANYTTVIIGKGQDIAFVKQIPIAGEQLDQQVAASLGISIEDAIGLRLRMRDSQSQQVVAETRRAVIDAMNNAIEDLAHEISLCFKYYAVTFRGVRPSEAIFAGREAYEPALMDSLRRHLGVRIQIAEPLRGYDLNRIYFNTANNPQRCEWATAVGLAIKGMEYECDQNEQEKKMTACNA